MNQLSSKICGLSALLVLIAQPPLQASEEVFPEGWYVGYSIGLSDQDGDISQKAKGPGVFNRDNKSYWREDSLDALNSVTDKTTGDDAFRGKLSFGYNFKVNDFIVSPEFSISSGPKSSISTTTGNVVYPCCDGTVNISQTIDPRLNLDGAVRIGYPIKKFMPYVLGGPSLSVAGVTNKFSDTLDEPNGIDAEEDFVIGSFGYTVGAGIEYALNKKSSLKLEYTYSKYYMPDTSASDSYYTSDKVVYDGQYHQGTLWLGGIFRL